VSECRLTKECIKNIIDMMNNRDELILARHLCREHGREEECKNARDIAKYIDDLRVSINLHCVEGF